MIYLTLQGQGQRAAAVSAPFDKVHFAKRLANGAAGCPYCPVLSRVPKVSE